MSQLLLDRADVEEEIECVLLDGTESVVQMTEQFVFYQPWLKPGSILMSHDWNT